MKRGVEDIHVDFADEENSLTPEESKCEHVHTVWADGKLSTSLTDIYLVNKEKKRNCLEPIES